MYPRTDLDGLPAVSFASLEASASDQSIAGEILRESIDDSGSDAAAVLAAHGLSLESPETEGVAPLAESATEPETSIAPPAPELGQLLVVVEPWGEVAVDGVVKGQTPIPELRLAAGGHEILLSNPNFVGVIRDRVQVIAGQVVQRKYSFNESGTLRLLVRPWANVSVDGRHAGQTPMEALRLPPGRHTIVLRHPELGEKTAVVDVLRDQEAVLEVEM